MTVLDASALLAFLFREPGHQQVAAVIDDSCMSTVNLAEVLTRFTRDGHAAAAVPGAPSTQRHRMDTLRRGPCHRRGRAGTSDHPLRPVARRSRLSRARPRPGRTGDDGRSAVGAARSRHPNRSRPLAFGRLSPPRSTRPSSCFDLPVVRRLLLSPPGSTGRSTWPHRLYRYASSPARSCISCSTAAIGPSSASSGSWPSSSQRSMYCRRIGTIRCTNAWGWARK